MALKNLSNNPLTAKIFLSGPFASNLAEITLQPGELKSFIVSLTDTTSSLQQKGILTISSDSLASSLQYPLFVFGDTSNIDTTDNDTLITNISISQKTVDVYPNPTKRIVKIKVDNGQITENSQIIILDSSGSFVLKKEISPKDELNEFELSPGIYCINIHLNSKTIKRKVIVE